MTLRMAFQQCLILEMILTTIYDYSYGISASYVCRVGLTVIYDCGAGLIARYYDRYELSAGSDCRADT
jgi:hypothetical protein